MTETEPKPFDGFKISHPTATFEVVCHDIQLSRQWRAGLWGDEKPEFLTSIHGQATGVDEVCVFGTGMRSKTFNLTADSDQKIEESWETQKRVELLVDRFKDPELLRIRNIQHERFDKLPPTAALFISGGFNLECNIPMPVLEQLASDLVGHSVDAVRISIRWPFALRDGLSGAWGFIKDDMLRGHISSFWWSSPKAPGRSKAAS